MPTVTICVRCDEYPRKSHQGITTCILLTVQGSRLTIRNSGHLLRIGLGQHEFLNGHDRMAAMKVIAVIFWIIGLAALVFLILRSGMSDIFTAVSTAGWGLGIISAWSLLIIAADAKSWQYLLIHNQKPNLLQMILPRWICSSINNLLPVAQVGGDVVRTRMLTWKGVSAVPAAASVIVDITIGIMTQIIFALIGLPILFQNDSGEHTYITIGLGVFVFFILVACFLALQHLGLFHRIIAIIEKISPFGNWGPALNHAKELDKTVRQTYQRRPDLLWSAVWRMIGWLLGTGEVWLALHFLGHDITIPQALMLESVGQAIRAGAFLIPGAMGVQEGAYMLLATSVGITPETGLALSLIKRFRELSLGLPAILVWQIMEHKNLSRNNKNSTKQ